MDLLDETFVFDASTCPSEGGFLFFDVTCEPFTDPVNLITQAILKTPFFNRQSTTLFGADVPNSSQSTFTYFANVSLIKSWKRSSGSLRFSRSDSGSLGGGSTSIVDRLVAVWRWRPSERWEVRTQASYSRRRSAAESQSQLVTLVRPTMPGDAPLPLAMLPEGTLVNTGDFGFIEVKNSTNVTSYGGGVSVTRRFTRKLSGIFRLAYRKQESKGSFSTVRNFEEYVISLSIRFGFDPIRF